MAHSTGMSASRPSWKFWLLCVLLFLLLVLWRLPASVLLSPLTEALGSHQAPAKSRLELGGRVVDGQLLWANASASPVFLRWQWQPMALWRGQLAWRFQGEQALRLSGEGQSSWREWQLQLRDVRLSLSDVLPFLPRGLQVDGTVIAQEVELRRRYRGEWVAARGEARWAGGPVRVQLSGQVQTLNLPPVRLRFATAGDSLQVALTEAAQGGALAELIVMPTGQVEWRLRERLLRYSPAYQSGGGDVDAVVITGRATP